MLDKEIIDEIRNLIFNIVAKDEYSVFIFGSSATSDRNKFSDIDIGFDGKNKVSPREWVELKDAFDNSNIPYIVDIVDFKEVTSEFANFSKNKIIKLN
jgi:predicted nucleotidyltransferase